MLKGKAAVHRGRWLQSVALAPLAVAFALSYLAWRLPEFAPFH